MPENPSSSNTNSPNSRGKPSPLHAAALPDPEHPSTLFLLPNPSEFLTLPSGGLPYPLRSSQLRNVALSTASRSVPSAHPGRPPVSRRNKGVALVLSSKRSSRFEDGGKEGEGCWPGAHKTPLHPVCLPGSPLSWLVQPEGGPHLPTSCFHQVALSRQLSSLSPFNFHSPGGSGFKESNIPINTA